jgi:hypothetical protein
MRAVEQPPIRTIVSQMCLRVKQMDISMALTNLMLKADLLAVLKCLNGYLYTTSWNIIINLTRDLCIYNFCSF